MPRSAARLGSTIRQAVRVGRSDGAAVVLNRVVRKATAKLVPQVSELPLFWDDIVTVDDPSPGIPWRDVAPTSPLLVDWVATPPAAASGGHTTMFRIIEELESRGHQCRLFLYDRYRGDLAAHEAVVRRWWPSVRATVHEIPDQLPPADAVFATAWETAHVVAKRSRAGRRFYLVQDFEPDFHPQSSERVLAEATYRFGFHGVTAGRWLADRLNRDYGMPCDLFPFGCDTDVYRLDNTGARNGVVFYAKPLVGRRGFSLGILALEELARRHPETDIHLFGDAAPKLPFRHISHGRLTPAQLNDLYNRCQAGLSLSLTNVSLIPWELLASGAVPVVNDAEHNRVVLDNPCVEWAGPSPAALADGLCRVIEDPQAVDRAADASRSVQGDRWDLAGELTESALRRVLVTG